MVDVARSVRRKWRRAEGTSIGLAVVVPSLSLEDTYQRLTDLAETTCADPDPRAVLAEFSAQRYASGVGLWIGNCPSDAFDDVLAWLADAFERRGMSDAALKLMPVVRPLGGSYSGVGYIKCLMALRGVQAPQWTIDPPWRRQPGWPAFEPAWLVSAADASGALDDLVTWALAIRGRIDTAAVSTGAGFVPVAVDDVLPFMRNVATATSTMLDDIELVVRCGRRFRSVDLRPGLGFATACQGDIQESRFDWRESLADCARLLEQPFDWCTYGHLTRGSLEPGISAFIGVFHGSLRFDAEWIGRAYLPRFVPECNLLYDVYGKMRLPKSIADALTLPGAWQRLDQGDYTVLSDYNPHAWFANTTIDPIVLTDCREAARQHLAPRTPGAELRVSDPPGVLRG